MLDSCNALSLDIKASWNFFSLNNFFVTLSVERGDFKNPILRNGDIIFIGKGAFINATNILSEIAKPFRDIVSTYSLIKIINE